MSIGSGNDNPRFDYRLMQTNYLQQLSAAVRFSCIFTSAKEVMFLPVFVCLSVCLCVYKITQNLMDGSF